MIGIYSVCLHILQVGGICDITLHYLDTKVVIKTRYLYTPDWVSSPVGWIATVDYRVGGRLLQIGEHLDIHVAGHQGARLQSVGI
jgi:hypothetical protein